MQHVAACKGRTVLTVEEGVIVLGGDEEAGNDEQQVVAELPSVAAQSLAVTSTRIIALPQDRALAIPVGEKLHEVYKHHVVS